MVMFMLGVLTGATITILFMLAALGAYAHAVENAEGRSVEDKLRITHLRSS